MAGRGTSVVQLDGPWTHRAVSAGGTQFHVVEAGEGPLVLLLHGFPEFWWSWRHQLVSLPAAGYRAAAVDLRGYGGSDKPPRGYDLVTLAGDAAGLVRALGEANAVIVGHDWGGLLAWTMAVYRPKVVHRLVTVSAPHPLRLRQAVRTGLRTQAWAARHSLGFQVPMWPERRLVRDDAALVGHMLREWSGPGWPDERTERVVRQAFQIPGVAHSAMEYHRWLVRSLARPDGIRYARRMRTPIQVPTLQLHGALDTFTLPGTAQGSGRYVTAPYRWKLIDGAGHFPHEERPESFDAALLGWLTDPEPDN
ncbi:alpha/beta fold hydrolase [Thermomonospora cellulosilytica]|uniref:Pimeloyl-ACP methyl ester carboxylesterase n=1 Tax=Thermomonospora cellulosilytica TaxID=1411118 RepID=A0A7W3MU65_9ACTN|nr:alpha/beta hydrolase [Thermomonospora cellulosilytica]MBA9001897.1 pimeloyl-ACP methyl ester carboxylesterase [Thermomonospora cellulosilytica]